MLAEEGEEEVYFEEVGVLVLGLVEAYVLEDGVVADEQLHELLLDFPGLLLEDEVQPIDVELGVLFEVYILYSALYLLLAGRCLSARLPAFLPALVHTLRLLLALEGRLAPFEVVIPHVRFNVIFIPFKSL